MNTVLDALAVARLYEVAFSAEGCLNWYTYEFASSIVMRAPEYISMGEGGSTRVCEDRFNV